MRCSPLDDETAAAEDACPRAAPGTMIGSDVALRADPTTHGIHCVEGSTAEASEHRRAGGPAHSEAAVLQRHEQAARADEAGRLVQPRREVVRPAAGVHLVADVGAAAGGGAVGEQRVALAAMLLDVEDEAGARLGTPGVAFLGKGEAERDDVAVGDEVLLGRRHREGGLNAVVHCRYP